MYYKLVLSKISSFIEKKPRTIIAVIIIITFLFSFTLSSLKMGTSIEDFKPNNEMVRADDKIDEYFGGNTEPLMVILHNGIDGKAIKKEYMLAQDLKKFDYVKDVIGIHTFIASMCNIEYQKDLVNCSEEEIKEAYQDLLEEKYNISLIDGEDAKYGFADVTHVRMGYDRKKINITFIVRDLNSKNLFNVEWFVSFKNRIDPAKLNLTYMITARKIVKEWCIGYGIRNNLKELFSRNNIELCLWIGKDGKFTNFDINGSIFIDEVNNSIIMSIPRKELSKYGIAPSFGNVSLPAKLYNIRAGARISYPFPFSISSHLILKLLSIKIIFKFANITKLLENKKTFSINDLNFTWKLVDEAKINDELLIKQPFMDEMKNSLLSFLSAEKNANLMIVEINGSLRIDEEKKVSKEIVDFIENKNIKAEVTGSGVILYQIDELTDKSNKIILPSIFIAIILILLINFKRPSYVLLSLSGLCIAIVWLLGTMALLGIKFNTLAVALIPLLMGLGVDYSVHIFHNYLTEIGRGRSVKDAITISVKEVGIALILATITTAVSFLSFLSASIPSLREFGIMAATGIAYTFIVAITFVAPARYLIDRKRGVKLIEGKKISFRNFMLKLSRFLCANPKKSIIIVIVVTIIMGFIATHVSTSFSLEEFMPKNSKAINTMKKLPDYFPSASQDQEYILIEGNIATVKTLKGIKETLNNMENDKYIVRLPNGKIKVESVYSLIESIVRENESIKDRFNIGEDGIPSSDKDVIELYDYIYKNYGRDAKNVLHKSKNGYDATVIRIYTQPVTTNEDMKNLYNELKNDLTDYGNAEAIVTGKKALEYTIMNSLTRSQITSTIVCIIVAGIVIMIVYRKLALGILTMLPVIISSIWILGTIYLLGYSLNVMTVMVTSLTIGLGITYAIHVVERFRLVADRTGEIIKAVEEAVANTGQAVLMAALTTIAGFAVLIFSPMPPEQQFGIVTAITILYSFITTILAVPPLLLLWGKWRKRKKGYIISPE